MLSIVIEAASKVPEWGPLRSERDKRRLAREPKGGGGGPGPWSGRDQGHVSKARHVTHERHVVVQLELPVHVHQHLLKRSGAQNTWVGS